MKTLSWSNANDITQLRDIAKKVNNSALLKNMMQISNAFSSGGFKSGIKAFGTYLTQGSKALIAAHPVITSIAALAAVGLGLDKFVFDADEKFDKASEALNSYNEVKSEIENINSELETTQSKIDELKAKGLNILLQSKIIELQNLCYNMCGFQITKYNNIPLNELTLKQLQIQIDYLNKWNFYISNCIDALPNEEFIQELLG